MEEVSGLWVNQNESIVELIEDEGAISGWYTTAKGRAAAGKRYPLTGVRNGDVLSFSVSWNLDGQSLFSITSFTARLVRGSEGEPLMHAHWILVRQFEDEHLTKPTSAWNSFLTNVDVFRRQAEL